MIFTRIFSLFVATACGMLAALALEVTGTPVPFEIIGGMAVSALAMRGLIRMGL